MSLIQLTRDTGRWLLDHLLPEQCIGCERTLADGASICPSCRRAAHRVEGARCPTCALPRPGWAGRPAAGVDAPCRRCRETPPPQDDAHAYWLYDDIVSSAIQRAKYADDRWRLRGLARPLAEWLASLWANGELAAADSEAVRPLVCAVPMHRDELRERGFNTAIQVARRATRDVDVEPAWELVAKTRPTRQQAGLSRSERLENVDGAFEVSQPARVDGRACLLVDDVITTGATAAEVAHTLADAGASPVSVVAAARTPQRR